jgi:hypothetical protein
MFAMGEVVTGTSLKKAYDDYWNYVISDRVETQPRLPRQHAKFKVSKQLPTKEEYVELKNRRFRTTVESLISDGYGMVRELADEMQEAFDNMPENLKEGDLGCRREETASSLNGISDHGDVALDDFPEIETVFCPTLDTSSRAKRAGEAADMLNTAASALREYLDNAEEEENKAEDLDSLANQLEEDSSELEGIDFPGMYG